MVTRIGELAAQLVGPSALAVVLMIALGFSSFALANVLVEAWTTRYSSVAVAGVTTLMAAAMLWILAIVLESPMSVQPSEKVWLQLAALGILGPTVPGRAADYARAPRWRGIHEPVRLRASRVRDHPRIDRLQKPSQPFALRRCPDRVRRCRLIRGDSRVFGERWPTRAGSLIGGRS